uniref:Uncharacterized protein n=1 Tax=Eutreptiella gymnastica TaxID=73025 RepID=A0A7S4GLI5_9EUGL
MGQETAPPDRYWAPCSTGDAERKSVTSDRTDPSHPPERAVALQGLVGQRVTAPQGVASHVALCGAFVVRQCKTLLGLDWPTGPGQLTNERIGPLLLEFWSSG